MIVTPILGTTKRLVDCGQSLHRVPDEIATASVVEQIRQFADGPWYACLMRANGRGTLRGESDTARRPPEEMVDTMLRLAVLLNREMHHDGHWVLFTSSGHITAFWRDRDGDVHFEITFDEPWSRFRAWPTQRFAQQCEAAYTAWADRLHMIEARGDKTIKAALGQAPAGPLH